MLKKILIVILVILALFFLIGRASAWTYQLVGSGVCQPDGSYKITWTANNPEDETLTITESNRAVVPVGETIPANDSESFVETIVGTSASSTALTLKGNFPSDLEERERSATVTLDEPCDQPPVVPPAPPPVTPAPVVPTPPVTPTPPVVETTPVFTGKGK